LLLNERAEEQWLRVKLIGAESNRDGVGARVAVLFGDDPLIWRRAHTDGSYLSASDGRVHFGLNGIAGVSGVLVEWPSGLSERWDIDGINRETSLNEGSGRPVP
jgi:hypothetical protein